MLTATMANHAEIRDKDYWLPDSDGLYLRVRCNGKKSWLVRFWIESKERRKTLGDFPDVSLAEARALRNELKRRIRDGLSLDAEDSWTLRKVAEEWLKRRMEPRRSEGYVETLEQRLRLYIFPALGSRAIKQIKRTELVRFAQSLTKYGSTGETAYRVSAVLKQVYDYAVDLGIIDYNIAQGLSRVLPERHGGHFATATQESDIGKLLRAIEGFKGHEVIRLALKIAAYTFVRSGELRTAEWSEVDLKESLWSIPAEHTKKNRVHLVPLSKQALNCFKRLKELGRGDRYVFFSVGNYKSGAGYISDGSMLQAIKKMRLNSAGDPVNCPPPMTVHGFRHMASSRLNESGLWRPEVIEKQLAHLDPNRVRAIYNNAEYMDERVTMMQWYADYLDALRDGKLPAS